MLLDTLRGGGAERIAVEVAAALDRDRYSARVLATTPMHYLKIDGSLMQRLATDQALQERVREFIAQAAKRNIATIAERVEDANTMAVLFQLGVGYVQGHYLHEPEVVLSDATGIIPR